MKLTEKERVAMGLALISVIHLLRPARGAELDVAVGTLRMPRREGEGDYDLRRRVADAYGLSGIVVPK